MATRVVCVYTGHLDSDIYTEGGLCWLKEGEIYHIEKVVEQMGYQWAVLREAIPAYGFDVRRFEPADQWDDLLKELVSSPEELVCIS